jgi:acetyl esterase/lipase
MAGEDFPYMRVSASILLPAFLIASFAAAQSGWPPSAGHTQIPIWPNGLPTPTTSAAPGANPTPAPPPGPEHDTTKPTDRPIAGRPIIRLGDVTVPTITLYVAPQANNTGAAVVVFPGGGYNILAIDLEGTEVCDWLNSIGVNCVLLKYRVPASGPYPKSSAALEDAQRAVGMVRQHAAEWGIEPKRVGVLGFSAGAHLAAALSTHYDQRLYPPFDAADQQSCKPDFAIVIYPGYLSIAEKNFEFNPDVPVTANVPPTFLVQAENDPVHVENVLQYFEQLKKAGVSAELHVYTKGGHGYGLRPTDLPITHWPDLATAWLKTIGVIGK